MKTMTVLCSLISLITTSSFVIAGIDVKEAAFDDDYLDCSDKCAARFPYLKSQEDVEGLVTCFNNCFDEEEDIDVKEARGKCLDKCDEQVPLMKTMKNYQLLQQLL
jgi:hypothetical protein